MLSVSSALVKFNDCLDGGSPLETKIRWTLKQTKKSSRVLAVESRNFHVSHCKRRRRKAIRRKKAACVLASTRAPSIIANQHSTPSKRIRFDVVVYHLSMILAIGRERRRAGIKIDWKMEEKRLHGMTTSSDVDAMSEARPCSSVDPSPPTERIN